MKQVLPVRVKARVVTGAGRGKKLGLPTINFDPLTVKDLRGGIYVCKVFFPSSLAYWGVLHFGPRPTFREDDISCEAYLLDFNASLSIPSKLEIEIYSYIRKVMGFKNPQEMVLEINRDIAIARVKIASYVKKGISS